MVELRALERQLLVLGGEALLQAPEPLRERLSLHGRGAQVRLRVALRGGVAAAGRGGVPPGVVAREDGAAGGWRAEPRSMRSVWAPEGWTLLSLPRAMSGSWWVLSASPMFLG